MVFAHSNILLFLNTKKKRTDYTNGTGAVEEKKNEYQNNEANPFSIHAVVTLSRVAHFCLSCCLFFFVVCSVCFILCGVCLVWASQFVWAISRSPHFFLSFCMPIKSCDVAVVSSYRFPAELNVIMLKSPKLVRLADFYLRQHKKGLDNFLICYLHILLNSPPPPPFYTRSFSFFLFKYFREEKQTGCVVSLFSQMNWNAPKNLVFFFSIDGHGEKLMLTVCISH